jgi:adenine-specific DNA methylase
MRDLVIHTPTVELFSEVGNKLAKDYGARMLEGKHWHEYKENTCIFSSIESKKFPTYCYMAYFFAYYKDVTIISAHQFLELEPYYTIGF